MSKNEIRRRVELDEAFLTNTPAGQSHSAGEPLEYYLLITTVSTRQRVSGKTYEVRKRGVEVLRGSTELECDEQLLSFVERGDVVVVR